MDSSNFKYKIIAFVGGVILGLFGFLSLNQASTTVGVALPQAVGVFETSLQTGITSSATSMTLTANSIRGGGSLSGYNCFTVDEGSANAETICGTVSGTSVTGLERGISQETGTTTVAALKFSHRRGASVKITDFPIIQRLKAQNAGEEYFDNLLSYATTTSECTEVDQICDKEYIDASVNQGAATATEAVGGISELATQIQMASSTDLGADNPLVIQAKYSTSSPDVRGVYNIISQATGYLKQSWLDLTEAFTFGSDVTVQGDFTAATTTLATTTISNITVTDGSLIPIATSTIFTTSGTWVLPDGVSTTTVIVCGAGGGGGGGDTSASQSSGGGGGGGGCAYAIVGVSSNVTVTVGTAGTAGAASGPGAGGAGGNSSFTGNTTITGAGGSGGTGGGGGAGGAGAGGGGGGCTNADVCVQGGTGGTGQLIQQGGGAGGNSQYGHGAVFNSTQDGAGGAGGNYGGGGSGGADGDSTGQAGGAGASGVVIVKWYED